MGSRDIRTPTRSADKNVIAPVRDVVAPPPHRSRSDDIARVEGFRVEGPEGRVGMVSGVSSSTSSGPPDTIDVVTGLFIVRVVPVAASEVVRIDDEQRRLHIRSMLRQPRSPNVSRMLRRFLASVGNGATPVGGNR